MKTLRNTTALAGFYVLCVSGAVASASEAINVPEQDILTAIEELSLETGTPIVVNRSALRSPTSRAVNGTMSTQEALRIMINDPDMTISELPDGSLVVTPGAQSEVVSQDALASQGFLLDTIILTGERVERDVFGTTSSVRAYGAQELEQNVQNSDFERVINDAANVTTFGFSNSGPVIRGQQSVGPTSGAGAALSGQLPRANITVDGRIQTFNELAYSPTSIWDLDVIEVFRGPQTTSQGANSIAGAFNIRTKDPIFEFEAAARAELGSNRKRIASFMINQPVSDSFAVRFTYEFFEEDGYISFPDGIPEDSEARTTELETARLKLLWEPVSMPELSSQLTFTYTDFSRPQTQNVRAPFENLESNNTDGFPSAFIGDTRAVIHDISYDIGNGFSVRNQFSFSDTSSARVTGNPADLELDTTGDDLTNELILDFSPEAGALSGFIGVYVRETTEEAPPQSLIIFEDDKSGFGVFGEVTYRFDNGFDVSAGLRYQSNDQDRLVDVPFLGVSLDYSGSFDAVLPKFTVGYEPSDDLRFSVQVSRGFNPGGVTGPFNAILGGVAPPDPFEEFEEETVTNIEFAMRGRFLDGRLFAATNLFYSDFQDYQFTVLSPIGGGFDDILVRNAEGVESYGLEVDLQFQATDRLFLTGALGLLRSEITEFSTATNNIVGNDTPQSPEFTLSIGADFEVTDSLTIGGQIRHTAGYFGDVDNTASEKTPSITTLDLRASYEVNPGVELYGYVNNAFDTIRATSIFAGGPTGLQGLTNKPREVGFGIRATF